MKKESTPKKILFLMFSFPDMTKSFNMYTSMVKQFHASGHDIVVIAPANEEEKTHVRIEDGVEVLRVKTLPIRNVANYIKGISNLLLPYQFKRAYLEHYGRARFDWIILPTPPITLVSLASYIKKRIGSNIYLILRDIFPQNAVDLGFMNKKGLIYKYFRRNEQQLYRIADLIGCMSMGNIEYLKENNPYINQKKLRLLENWQDPFEPANCDVTDIKERFSLTNKFTVVFGGNMGKPQQLENVLELARKCEIYENVQFLLIGAGVAMDKLSRKIEESNIRNINLKRTMPKREYQCLLSYCQLGLISLHRNFTIPNIPSKTLDYFNVGLPVLASIDTATDFNIILDSSGGGLWSVAGNHECLFANFKLIYFNKLLHEKMGTSGKRFYQNHMRSDYAYHQLVSQLNSF